MPPLGRNPVLVTQVAKLFAGVFVNADIHPEVRFGRIQAGRFGAVRRAPGSCQSAPV
jgi:hypothetical protein